MGSKRSGRRWRHGAAERTDDYTRIDVRVWHRLGLLTPGKSYRWQWKGARWGMTSIKVVVEGDRLTIATPQRFLASGEVCEPHTIQLDHTPCNYGGARPWFRCPECGGRVAVLYGGPSFACRHCRHLAYPSQRHPQHQRTLLKAEHIRRRLGWPPGILNPVGDKPKGMHRQTFERLTTQYQHLVPAILADITERLGYPLA